MSTEKHTPAPWTIRFFREGNPSAGFFIEAKNNNKPELGYGIEIMGEDFGDHNGYPLEQRLADAELIASAPSLKQENEKLKAENARLREALQKIDDIAMEKVYDSRDAGYINSRNAGVQECQSIATEALKTPQ